MTKRRSHRWLEGGLLLLGVILLGLYLKDYGEAQAYQSAQSKRLDSAVHRNEMLSGAARPSAAPHPLPVAEGVMGRIEIPRLKISAIIAEGIDTRTLKRAVGHIPATRLPGEVGNVGLAAHRDGFFRGLGEVRKDDLILIVTPERTYSYHVEWGEVMDPHRVDVLRSTSERWVTLVTCYPFHWIGKAPQRFIVRAEQFDSEARSSR
jgi:sortase A